MEEVGFSASVHSTMDNRFIINPTNEVVIDAVEIYSVGRSILRVDIVDVKTVINDADNVILLSGNATNKMSTADAIGDAVLHTCSIAKGYDLFTAEKLLVLISYSKAHPMLVTEIAAAVQQFFEMFPSPTTYIWGIAENDCDNGVITAQIIASNLKKRIIK